MPLIDRQNNDLAAAMSISKGTADAAPHQQNRHSWRNDDKEPIPLLLGGVQGDRRAAGPLRVAAAAQQTAQGVLVGRLYLEYARSGVFERDERRAADPAGLF